MSAHASKAIHLSHPENVLDKKGLVEAFLPFARQLLF
jgi:hypothetical protein